MASHSVLWSAKKQIQNGKSYICISVLYQINVVTGTELISLVQYKMFQLKFHDQDHQYLKKRKVIKLLVQIYKFICWNHIQMEFTLLAYWRFT